ncbi:hypothetical protein ABPG72_004952 [Tetrahymena utriculariae]
MSWRNFLTPYGEKYLVQKEEDHSISQVSQNSCSPIHGIHINKSKGSLDISQTTYIQQDISKLLNNNLPVHFNNNSNNNSARKNHNKSELEDNTYNISITQDPFANSSNNVSYNLSVQQKPSKYENKLAKIKDEMSKLKIELSKFPKKNGRKNSQPSAQTAIKTDGNYGRISNENINPIIQSQRQSLQSINYDNQFNNQQQLLMNRHRNSLQQIRIQQDLSITNHDELSFSQNKQVLDHDSFITEDDIQQISDSLQDHLNNYNKFSDKLNVVQNMNMIHMQQQNLPPKNSQLTTAHLTNLNTQQNKINRNQFTNIQIVKQTSDKEIQTQSFKEQESNTTVATSQADQQKSSDHHKIASLRQDRNQLLEALENVLQVISIDKQKNSDTKQISQLKECQKQMKKVKKSFKRDLNTLRQEFLEIGHIEPLNMSYKKEFESLINYSSVQSHPKHSIKNSPNNSNLKNSSTLITTTLPQYYFMPLQQNKSKNTKNEAEAQSNPGNLFQTDEIYFRQNGLLGSTDKSIKKQSVNNLALGDEISFRQNMLLNKNNPISQNNSSNKPCNTSNLLSTEDISFRLNVPTPLHLSQKSYELKQKISKNSKQVNLNNPNNNQNNNNSSPTNSNNMQNDQNNENKGLHSTLSLMEQYKQQQLEKYKPFDKQHLIANFSDTQQSLTPSKYLQKNSFSKESIFNSRLSPNQLQNQKVSPKKDFNLTNLESNYQTFQQQEQQDSYYNY